MLHITFILRFISASKGLLVDRECDMGYIYIYMIPYIYMYVCVYTLRLGKWILLFCIAVYCTVYCIALLMLENTMFSVVI